MPGAIGGRIEPFHLDCLPGGMPVPVQEFADRFPDRLGLTG